MVCKQYFTTFEFIIIISLERRNNAPMHSKILLWPNNAIINNCFKFQNDVFKIILVMYMHTKFFPMMSF